MAAKCSHPPARNSSQSNVGRPLSQPGEKPAQPGIENGPAETMNQKELKELIEFLIEKDIAEFELERGDVKVRIKRGVESAHAPDSRFYAVPAAASAVELVATSPVASPA